MRKEIDFVRHLNHLRRVYKISLYFEVFIENSFLLKLWKNIIFWKKMLFKILRKNQKFLERISSSWFLGCFSPFNEISLGFFYEKIDFEFNFLEFRFF